jgi:hypothetical protein
MLFARYYFWIAPHLLLAILLVRLVRLRMQEQLPFFLAYILFELVEFLASFIIGLFIQQLDSPFRTAVYRWVVLVFGNGINTLLGLGVIYELGSELVISHSPLAPVLRRILGGILALLVLVAAISSGAMSDVSVHRVVNIFQVLDFSSSLIQVGMLLVLFVLTRVLQISWRSWTAGIALGLGISACIDLASAAWRANFGESGFIAVDIAQMAAFHVCVVVWLVYLFLPERARTFSGAGLEKNDLELWNEQVEKMVRR